MVSITEVKVLKSKGKNKGIEITYSILTYPFVYCTTHFSVAPSGGRASLQLFTLAKQTNKQKMTYTDNSSFCFAIYNTTITI